MVADMDGGGSLHPRHWNFGMQQRCFFEGSCSFLTLLIKKTETAKGQKVAGQVQSWPIVCKLVYNNS